jgi:hypothetical protein
MGEIVFIATFHLFNNILWKKIINIEKPLICKSIYLKLGNKTKNDKKDNFLIKNCFNVYLYIHRKHFKII